MFSKEEVKHIAKLARLGLTEKEIEKFRKDLSSILDYFEKLKEVDVAKIEPTSQSVLLENIIREDKMRSGGPSAGEPKKLLELAPETKDGFLKVKPIISR